MNKKSKSFFIVLLVTAITAVFAGYMLVGNKQSQPASTQVAKLEETKSNNETPDPGGFLSVVTGAADTKDVQMNSEGVLDTFIKFLIAVGLSGILAFRPRKNLPFFKRNLYVAQTQILLAVVAAALMMIVGDNTARAFAIFAAVSLVRFRTNIKDPKEITVLLISLALGLAAGVGRWELGLALCFFVSVLLWVLEYNESDQVFRPMQLTIKTRNTEQTQNILKQVFNRYNLEYEVRVLNPPEDEDSIGSVVYFLNLRLTVSTDNLSDKIMALDTNNIDSVEWKQQKSMTNTF